MQRRKVDERGINFSFEAADRADDVVRIGRIHHGPIHRNCIHDVWDDVVLVVKLVVPEFVDAPNET